MGKVTPQTVQIKKSPRSTFGLSRTKTGSARIGDLNVVEHIMMQPSDMARISVDTSILFISPLSVPAFARMKVITYYFFDAYQNVFPDFNDVIQNYTHEEKNEIKNGVLVSHSGYNLPFILFNDLSNYINTSLHWNKPTNPSSSYSPPPFGNLDSYDDGWQSRMYQFPMKYDFCFSSYEQKVDIVHLCNQLDILPYGFGLPLSKSFQNSFLQECKDIRENISNINPWIPSSLTVNELKNSQFINYWNNRNIRSYTNNYPNIPLPLNILPFKCYQHIFNDFFLDTQKNAPIDLFPDAVTYDITNPYFRRQGPLNILNTSYNDFKVQMFSNRVNYYMNSIFAIRRPWYSKDYFNTSTNDPTLGVSPYSVGTSILDLRKNSALQRLAEKKALCGNKFIDFIVQHFNYYPPSLSVGRPIHLSTTVDYVNVSQVLQTSQTTSESAQGERAATASSYGRSHGVFFKAPTYGELMVLQCIKPEIDYYEGIPREMQIVDVSDMPLPELAQIGFDSINQSELFLNLQSTGTFNQKFGYTPRYSWRKTRLNRIYGQLCGPLNYWHQSPSLRFGVYNQYDFGQIGFDIKQQWNSEKDLSDNTTTVSPSYNRIFAVTDLNDDTYVYQYRINLSLKTCLPTNDSPQL